MTDVIKLLSQLLDTWHGDNINMWQCLAMEKAFNLQPIKGEGHGLCLVEGEHSLTIYCSVKV